jgi:hypothetical protein
VGRELQKRRETFGYHPGRGTRLSELGNQTALFGIAFFVRFEDKNPIGQGEFLLSEGRHGFAARVFRKPGKI